MRACAGHSLGHMAALIDALKQGAAWDDAFAIANAHAGV